MGQVDGDRTELFNFQGILGRFNFGQKLDYPGENPSVKVNYDSHVCRYEEAPGPVTAHLLTPGAVPLRHLDRGRTQGRSHPPQPSAAGPGRLRGQAPQPFTSAATCGPCRTLQVRGSRVAGRATPSRVPGLRDCSRKRQGDWRAALERPESRSGPRPWRSARGSLTRGRRGAGGRLHSAL